MPSRRLVLLVPGDIDTRTGGYEYDRRIRRGLGARGWDVSVVSLRGNYPFPSGAARLEAEAVLASIDDGALVLADGLAFGALPRELARCRARLRFVALVHHPLSLETGLSAADAAALQAAEHDALQSARAVVVTSPRTVEAVVALGVERSRIAVVEPGTDAAPIAEGSGPGAPPCLLCVGSVVPRKGHAALLAALSTLKDLGWRLVCGGSLERDPALAAALQRQVDASGLSDRVAFVGELDEGRLASAYAHADLFVLPTCYEGYGMVVAEALARGIPVVSTPTGAIPDLVGEDAGRLVPAGDAAALAAALREILTDAGMRARLREGALRRRRQLSTWEDAARRMEACLDDAAQER